MERVIKWKRSNGIVGTIYTSTCERFTITQRSGGWSASRRFYVLESTAFKIPRFMREHDTLRDAKDWAEMEHNPNWEP